MTASGSPSDVPSAVPLARPLLGIGQVRHTRLRPVAHAFVYPTYFLLLPMRRLAAQPCPALRRNGRGLLSFHDSDHGDGRADSLAWIDELLQQEGLADATGEVWLHCYPRVLGHTFKPVSFWYCHRPDGGLAAIVVEVNNTFGERHCYLLTGDGRGNGAVAFGKDLHSSKVFHVSPFCGVAGHYRFRFMRTDLGDRAPGGGAESVGRTVARIDHGDADGPVLQTSVSGDLAPLTPRRIRTAFFRVPLMTLGVVMHIHGQAAKLWLKNLPFFRKPDVPARFVTR